MQGKELSWDNRKRKLCKKNWIRMNKLETVVTRNKNASYDQSVNG